MQRREYLDNVERMRGQQARANLEQAIKLAWGSRQQTTPESSASPT
ncbi:MAG: hypothetical protein MUE59_03725 [Thiobacillaceae bacterium]|nr:hypothetical protein [Thiobacillaceae bacterium]